VETRRDDECATDRLDIQYPGDEGARLPRPNTRRSPERCRQGVQTLVSSQADEVSKRTEIALVRGPEACVRLTVDIAVRPED
jgi:hypothetical protein